MMPFEPRVIGQDSGGSKQERRPAQCAVFRLPAEQNRRHSDPLPPEFAAQAQPEFARIRSGPVHRIVFSAGDNLADLVPHAAGKFLVPAEECNHHSFRVFSQQPEQNPLELFFHCFRSVSFSIATARSGRTAAAKHTGRNPY